MSIIMAIYSPIPINDKNGEVLNLSWLFRYFYIFLGPTRLFFQNFVQGLFAVVINYLTPDVVTVAWHPLSNAI